MDRYKIALLRASFPDKACISFKPTRSLIRAVQSIEECIRNGYILNISNQNEGVMDSALINISKKYNAPIVTFSEQFARSISISHTYQRVYSLDKIPERFKNIISYWDLDYKKLPAGITPILIVQK